MIEYSYIINLYDKKPKKVKRTIVQFWRALQSRKIERKDKAPLFFACTFSKESKLKSDVESLSMIVIDIDGKENKLSFPRLEDVNPDYKDITFFCYTTFNHSSSHPKWRMIIPLKKKVDPSNWNSSQFTKGVWDQGVELFGKILGLKNPFKFIDRACSNSNRGYYYPSHKEGKEFLSLQRIGRLVSLEAMELKDVEHRKNTKIFSNLAKQQKWNSRIDFSNFSDFDIEIKNRLKTEKGRKDFAIAHNLNIKDGIVTGWACLWCKRSDATFFYLKGRGIFCRHLESCGFRGFLIDLARHYGDV